MFDDAETANLPILLRPYGKAERALGELAFALRTTPLHATWLWRELTRVSVLIAQIRGYRVRVSQLRMALIGAPLDPNDNTSGLAAAKRIFLAAEPLFRSGSQTDSALALLPAFWHEGGEPHGQGSLDATAGVDGAGEVARPQRMARPQQGERQQLLGLVRELAGFADDGRRPALINLLIDLKKHAAGPTTKRLPTPLVRIALPLALSEAGLVPKAAPGLLGGGRLSLGMSRAVTSDQPLTAWLKGGLNALTEEADESCRRLLELRRQHQAWHDALTKKGLRKHARAPRALDLLAATPVLTIGLVARHLGCSHVAASGIIGRLVDLGILIEQTSRSRHKVFVAGDLPAESRGEVAGSAPLSFSDPAPLIDVDAVSATLDGLFADLDRLNERARDRMGIED
ncbi:MAG: hypothetical protein ACR2QJ_06205 [Geminicoccaceae bacterium]